MANEKTPVVWDDDAKKHRPLGSGEKMGGLSASSMISSDSGNLLQQGSDGLMLVTGSSLADPRADNLLEATSAGKLKVDMDRIIEWLDGHPADAKAIAEAINVVSGDSGNLIHEGSDGGAYMSSAQLAAAIAALTDAQLQAVAARLAPDLADGLTVVLNAAGKLSVGDISGAAVAASGASVERALGDRFADFVNVKDYGAVENAGAGYLDGTMASNAEAVQTSIDAAAAAGKSVWIPEGVKYYRSGIDAGGVLVLDDSAGRRVTSRDWWWKPGIPAGGIFRVAHRGLSACYPENTAAAFRAAGQLGFGGIETDVQWTSDGHPVCMHDATVDRTTDGTGSVADMTLAQIQALDAGSFVDGAFSGCRVPTVEEYLGVCRAYGAAPFIEIKTANNVTNARLLALLETVDGYGLLNRAVFLSFEWSYLGTIRSLSGAPGVCGLANAALSADNKQYLEWLGGRVYWGPSHGYATEALVSEAAAAGIATYAWTVDGAGLETAKAHGAASAGMNNWLK